MATVLGCVFYRGKKKTFTGHFCLLCGILFCFSYQLETSTLPAFDELVKPPCDKKASRVSNFTGNSVNCTDGQTNLTGNNTCRRENTTDSEECGGFGQSRGNTGIQIF